MPNLSRSIPEITVFLSSPSDVVAERQIVKRAIQEINADPAWQSRCILKPLAYEDGEVPSQMGKSAQRVVDDFMRMSCEADIVVCLICNRMGTPMVDERTGQNYLSGTHYEFDSAYRSYKDGRQLSPRILLYLGSRDFSDDSDDEAHEQYNAARKFKKHIRACTEYDGLYFEYRELSQLETLVRIHLKRHLVEILAAIPQRPDVVAQKTRDLSGLGDLSTDPIRIYLSSTAEDLKFHRQSVLSAIRRLDEGRGRFLVTAMEDYSSQDALPVEKCRQGVASCHVYIGLFAWRYGFVPDGHNESITEQEYRQAVESKLTILPFLLAEEVAWVPKFVDTGEKAESLKRLRAELMKRQLCGFFTNPEGLAAEVVTSLTKLDYRRATPAMDGSSLGARDYLGQLAESYRWLELQGIREAGALRIELEKVYVALKAEPESEYDRQQAANLHSVEVREAAGVDSLDIIDPKSLEQYDADIIRRTYRPAREDAKRATVTVVRTLGDAFRQNRRMVILGGPGSGKTTIGRWLALQLARAMLRQLDMGSPQRIQVRVSQVDPDDLRLGEDLIDLGPARLPIFLRLAHFARELAERERQQQPSIALIDYLGHDPDSRSLADGLIPEARNSLFRSHLHNGQAVCVLDGLDELPEANRRDVVLKIQDFIEKQTQQNSANATGDLPWEVGGNQVVVASRYVGYKFAPVRAGCAHFGIQSMQRPAVERFARAWTESVNTELATEVTAQ